MSIPSRIVALHLLWTAGLGLLGVPAYAQAPTCIASATSLPMRAESYTDPAGDIILTCNNPGGATTLNIYAQPGVNVTSRLLMNFSAEALALVDDPPPSSQVVNTNVFQGIVPSPTLVGFIGVPLASGSHFFRLTNIRLNAIGNWFLNGPVPISAIVSATYGPTNITVSVSNPSVTIATVQPGIAFQIRTANDAAIYSGNYGANQISQCGNSAAQCPLAVLRFSENFANAAKPRSAGTYTSPDISPAPPPQDTEPGANSGNDETGFYNPSFPNGANGNLGVAGLADTGTRFKVVFNNIPAGVTLYFSTEAVTFSGVTPSPNISSATPVARLVASDMLPFTTIAPNSIINGVPAYGVTSASGTATAVWEVLNANPSAIENFDFLLWIAYSSSPVSSGLSLLAGLGPDQNSMSAAGLIQPGIAEPSTYPVPRYQNGDESEGLFTVRGDYDGNRVPDLVWMNESTHQVTVNYYSMSGMTPSLTGWAWLNSIGIPGWHVVGAADFDGNGVPDLVWMNDSTHQVTVNYYTFSGGIPLYSGWAWLNSVGIPGWSVVAVADVDGNGVPDLIWQNDTTRQVTVNYYTLNNGVPRFAGWAWLNSTGFSGWTVAGMADYDGNGVPDLVWMNTGTRQVTVNYYSNTNGAPLLTGWAWLNSGGIPGWHVAGVNDYDGNGVPDLVWENDATHQMTLNFYGFSGGLPLYLTWGWLNSSGIPGWDPVVPR